MTTIAAVDYPKEGAMQTDSSKDYALSPWWRKGAQRQLLLGTDDNYFCASTSASAM